MPRSSLIQSLLSRRFWLAFAALAGCCAATAVPACAQELIAKYEAQYGADTDWVHRAKILAKLGPAAMERTSQYLKADQDEKALAVLRTYRDEVRDTVKALTSRADAERHPPGFKELQISLRETTRRLSDMMATTTLDERMEFRAVLTDLVDSQNALIDALFPSPDRKEGKKAKAE